MREAGVGTIYSCLRLCGDVHALYTTSRLGLAPGLPPPTCWLTLLTRLTTNKVSLSLEKNRAVPYGMAPPVVGLRSGTWLH